jgi:RNA polymerase sigma-70 factor (ECF subfamily)
MPPAEPAPLRLQRASGPACEDLVLRGSGTRTIGRGSESDHPLDDPGISRHHAQVDFDGSHASIIDLGSTHGTLLNGARLEPNESMPLHDRDLVTIGPWTFVARVREEAAESHVVPEAPPIDHAEAKDPYRTRASVLLRLRADGTLDRQVGWNDFARIYGPVIAGFARNAGVPPQEVDDVLQDVMLGFFRQSQTFEYDPKRGRFRGYLKTVTLNAIRDRHRRKRPKVGLPEHFEPSSDDDALHATWDHEWTQHLLRRAMEKVRATVQPRTLEAFERYGVRGEPAESVSRALGMSEASIRHAKMRIMHQLREEIQRLRDEEG